MAHGWCNAPGTRTKERYPGYMQHGGGEDETAGCARERDVSRQRDAEKRAKPSSSSGVRLRAGPGSSPRPGGKGSDTGVRRHQDMTRPSVRVPEALIPFIARRPPIPTAATGMAPVDGRERPST